MNLPPSPRIRRLGFGLRRFAASGSFNIMGHAPLLGKQNRPEERMINIMCADHRSGVPM